MNSLKEKKILVRMKQRLGEDVPQELLDEIAAEEASIAADLQRQEEVKQERKEAFKNVFGDLSSQLKHLMAEEKKKTEEEQALLDRFANVMSRVDEIKAQLVERKDQTTEEFIEEIIPQTIEMIPDEIVETTSIILAPEEPPVQPPIKDPIKDVAKNIKVNKPPSMFVQPDPAPVSRDIKDIQNKLKLLEGWVGKISMSGPGGGAVWLRDLDDVARSSVLNATEGQVLTYNETTKKWEAQDPAAANGGYTLPTASTTVKGGVKIDGTTITINNQVISANIPAQVQSDWSQSNVSAASYINNKPSFLTTETDTLNTVTTRGNTTNNTIIVGHTIPAANLTYSLGNNTNRWESLWVGANSITFSDTLNGPDQTLSLANQVFYITQGGGSNTTFNANAGFNAGGIILQNYTMQLANTTQDLVIGSASVDTSVIVNQNLLANTTITFSDTSVQNVAFHDTDIVLYESIALHTDKQNTDNEYFRVNVVDDHAVLNLTGGSLSFNGGLKVTGIRSATNQINFYSAVMYNNGELTYGNMNYAVLTGFPQAPSFANDTAASANAVVQHGSLENGLTYFNTTLNSLMSYSVTSNGWISHQTSAGLSANVAKLSSNNSLYLGGVAANQYAYANQIIVQSQSDWTQSNTTAIDFIKNKPTIPSTIDSLTDVTITGPQNNQVLTYNTATTQWINQNNTTNNYSTGYYGGFIYTGANVALSNTANVYIVPLTASQGASGISLGANNNLIFAYAGTYEVVYSIQYENDGNDDDYIDVWIRLNGANLTDTNSQFAVNRKNTGNHPGELIAVTPFQLTLSAGDSIQVATTTNSGNAKIVTIPAQTNPAVPRTPAVIVNAQQVSSIVIPDNIAGTANNATNLGGVAASGYAKLNANAAFANVTADIITSNAITANASTAFIAGTAAVSGVALSMPRESGLRNSYNGDNAMYFDVSNGGSTHGSFQFRSTSSFTSLLQLKYPITTFNSDIAIVGQTPSIAKTAWNSALATEITLGNLKFRIANSGGIFPQAIGVSGSVNAAWTCVAALNGAAISQAGSTGTIISNSVWTTIYAAHGMDAAGDTITATLQDKAAGRIYRVTFMRSDDGTTTGYNIVGERLL